MHDASYVVAAAIASVRDTDSLLRRIVDHAMAVLGADGCAIWMFDETWFPRLKALVATKIRIA
ncbi:MAG: hypothetical protein AB7R89_04025 [Dehalococcoidia bacterium]